jgi:hypothetical protein
MSNWMSDEELEEYLVENLGDDHKNNSHRYRIHIKQLVSKVGDNDDLKDAFISQIEEMYELLTDISIREIIDDKLCGNCLNLCQLCQPRSDLVVGESKTGDSKDFPTNDEKW